MVIFITGLVYDLEVSVFIDSGSMGLIVLNVCLGDRLLILLQIITSF